jgi:uncharacterized protein involved in outer membrane biogenesis
MNQQPSKGARRRWPWFLAATAAFVFSCSLILLVLVSRYDVNNLKPLVIRIVKEMTGRELSIHGPIRIETDLTPCLVVEKVAFQNAPWGAFPAMAEAERLELEIALFPLLRKKIQVKKAILIEPKFLVETDPSGRSNLSFQTKGKAPPSEGTPSVHLERMVVERGLISYKNGKTGKTLSVVIDRLQARKAKAGDRIELEMCGIHASRRFELNGWVGSIASLMTPEEPWWMDLTARALDTEMRLNGFVRSFGTSNGLVLKVKGEGSSIKGLTDGVGPGRIPELGPFKIECDLFTEKDRTFRLSGLKFSTKAGSGKGELKIRLNQGSPELRGWLSCGKLDVCTMLSKEAMQKTAVTGSEKKEKILPSQPFPFERMGKMRGEVEITIDEVILPRVVLGGLKTKVYAAEGRFAAKQLRLKPGGGDTDGSLEVRQEGSVVSVVVRAKVSQADLSLLLQEKKAQGEVEAEIDVTARGASVAELMRNLNGRALFAVRGFKVDNKYVKVLGSDFITNLLQVFAPASREANTTEINCLVSGFDITNGLAEVTAMVADTREMIVMGRGRVDLKEERLDLTISPYQKKGVVGLSFSLSEVMRVFRLGGTFARPSLEIDPLRTGLTIGKLVGGVLLMGPAGVALAFAGKTAGDEDVCMAAMEAARNSSEVPDINSVSENPGTPIDGYGCGP